MNNLDYEKWSKYVSEHFISMPRADWCDYEQDWEGRARIARGLIRCNPPQLEPAIEIFKTVVDTKVKDDPTIDTSSPLELKIFSLYELGWSIVNAQGDMKEALNYTLRALKLAESSLRNFDWLLRGELFYSYLCLLKKMGMTKQALIYMKEKMLKYHSDDGRSNSYLYFSYLFQAELAKDNDQCEKAVDLLKECSKYYPLTAEGKKQVEQVWNEKPSNCVKTYNALKDGLANYQAIVWDHDGPYSEPIINKSPLRIAIEEDNVGTALELIRRGDIQKDELLLHLAVSHGHVELVEALIKEGLEVDSIDEFGCTPLYESLNHWRPLRIVELLLSAGANPNANCGGHSILTHAATYASSEMVERLLQAGANVNSQDERGNLPLVNEAKNSEIVRPLLEYGADPNCRDSLGNTPLTKAALQGNWQSIQLLLEKQSPLTKEILFNAMKLAAHYDKPGNIEVIKGFIEMGVSVTEENSELLRCASENGCVNMIEFLISMGALVNDQNHEISTEIQDFGPLRYLEDNSFRKGITALSLAAVKGYLAVVNRLILNGADIDLADSDGITPIMCAAFGGHEKVVRLLIDEGANITATDRYGFSALDYARRNKRYLCTALLEKVISESKEKE